MSDTDWNYIESLLNVAAKCAEHSGKLSSIMSLAIGELIAINDQIKAEAVAKAEDARAEAAANAPKTIPSTPEDNEDPEVEDPEVENPAPARRI